MGGIALCRAAEINGNRLYRIESVHAILIPFEFASPRPIAAGRRMRFDILAFLRPQHNRVGQALNLLIHHEPTGSS